MTTVINKGFNVSTEALQKAQAGNFYWHLQPDKKSQVTLTGAMAKWKKDPSFIYLPSLHIAGTQANLQTALVAWQAPNPGQYFVGAYTAALAATPDTDPLKAAFNAEVERTRLSNAAKKATKKVWTTAEITFFAANLGSTTVVDSSGAPMTAKAPGKRAAAPRDVLGRLRSLASDKVLDATKATADGKNIRSIKAPGLKSQKRGPVINERDLQIVNKRIISNNLVTYQYALASVFGAGSPLIGKYSALWSQSRAATTAPNLQLAATPMAVAPRSRSPVPVPVPVAPVAVGSTSPALAPGTIAVPQIPSFVAPGTP